MGDFKKHFLIGGKEHTNYAITDYIQRKTLLVNERNCINGIQLEWEEVRIGDQCAEILLKLQILTNQAQAAAEGKMYRHSKCPQGETKKTRRSLNRPNRQGGLIINTEVYPCMKRACVALSAMKQTRLKKIYSRGIEHKAHVEAYDQESKEGNWTL